MGQQALYVTSGVGFDADLQTGILLPYTGGLPEVDPSIQCSDSVGAGTWFHCRRTAVPDLVKYYSASTGYTYYPYGKRETYYGLGPHHEQHDVVLCYGSYNIGISTHQYQGSVLGGRAYRMGNARYYDYFRNYHRCEVSIWSVPLPDCRAWSTPDMVKALLAVDWSTVEPYVMTHMCEPYTLPFINLSAKRLDFNFKYNELGEWDLYSFLKRDANIDILSPLYSSGCGAAYINMIADMPESQVNSCANVLETANLVKGALDLLVKRDVRGLCKNFRSNKNPRKVWLKYRYQYLTTSSDVSEYADLTSRLCDLSARQSETFSCRGTYRRGEILFRCEAKFKPNILIPENTAEWLRAYGFKLSAVNAWDMVPYSFVVDWFLHISDILDYFESYGNAIKYRPEEMWYSIETSYDAQTAYMRFPSLAKFRPASSWYKPTSKRTLIMRLTDVLALFF